MGLDCCSRKVFTLQGKRLGASPPGFQQANVGLSAQRYFTMTLKIVSSDTQYLALVDTCQPRDITSFPLCTRFAIFNT
jgi:hypothetical protein